MKTKTKKIIIIISSIVGVLVIGLIGFLLASNLATTTINDLRILEVSTNKEISEKRVYLTAEKNNYFDIKLKTSASRLTNYVVTSSDTSVASVSAINGGYRINYKKAGDAKIIATTTKSSNIKDVVNLEVVDFVPTDFELKNTAAKNKIEIFADGKEYRYDFTAFQGLITSNINKSSIKVVDNYDKSVFKSVKIDDVKSQLVVSVNKSQSYRNEIITLQTKQLDNEGNVKFVKNFIVEVDIKGYYIVDIQLMLSNNPNFTTSTNIYSEKLKNDMADELNSTLLNENEKEVNEVILTQDVHFVYAKVRVVYTNKDKFDVTTSVTSQDAQKSQLTDYFTIDIRSGSDPSNYTYKEVVTKFSYQGFESSFIFNYLPSGETGYNNFINNNLYVLKYDGNNPYYEYCYWDSRYKRTDAITDSQGRIIDFVDEDYMS